MKTYFDLLGMRSYKTSGYSGIRYAFYQGNPVLVEDESDIRKFRMHDDIFFECTEDGLVIVKEIDTAKAIKYVKFNSKANEIANEIAETIEENNKVEVKREVIDTNKLLDEVNKDIEEAKKPAKKVAKTKKAFECELCGQSFKNQTELNKHLEAHEDED